MSTRTVPTPTGQRGAHAMLAAGFVAGPLYLVVFVAQVILRDGFDVTRHAGSLLMNGPAGWVQGANFVLTGTLLVLAAVGVRSAGATWAGRLLGVYGASFVVAGLFPPDPAFGFPPGAPERNGALSWPAAVHFAAGGIGFLCFLACCLIFARSFARSGERGWAVFSAVTGLLFLAAFAGIASGSGGKGLALAFVGAVLLGFAWIAAVCAHLRSSVALQGKESS